MSDRGADPFRYCALCGVDCYHADYIEPDEGEPRHYDPDNYDPDVEHMSDCPSVTGLYPVTAAVLGLVTCPACSHEFGHGMVCMDCGDEFHVGDLFAHRQSAPDICEVVCLGCRVLNPEATA